MKRASFEPFAKRLRKQGFSEEGIRGVLKDMIKKGLVEGSDVQGYILTEKGVTVVEKEIYGNAGVV